jgi:type I restriction enzyme R subunit
MSSSRWSADEEITEVEELNRVLDRAVGLRTFLARTTASRKWLRSWLSTSAKRRPAGLQGLPRRGSTEACAKYKQALDRHLPPEWSEAVYSKNPADIVDRPLVADLQLSDDRRGGGPPALQEAQRAAADPDVTDKLLTGYDAPVLYALYLDKAHARSRTPAGHRAGETGRTSTSAAAPKRVGYDRRFRRRPP